MCDHAASKLSKDPSRAPERPASSNQSTFGTLTATSSRSLTTSIALESNGSLLLFAAFQSSPHSVPGERGAPDAVRGLNDALERREVPELLVLLGAHHLQKGLYLGLGLLAALAFEALGHHRSRGLAYGAATPCERYL